uniref:Uncharacterized protein n=1 Tax=Coccidioides posadasii RMSCC 3488 TaxID=454284 RepID=A0A0J6IJZ5_COCPO|nr:hypothetical protein CPAG_08544 [Coccidioides posadasii RMSCC 3488]
MANTVSFDCGRSTIELSSRSTWWIKARLLDELDDDSAMMFKKSVHDGRMMVAVAVVPLGSGKKPQKRARVYPLSAKDREIVDETFDKLHEQGQNGMGEQPYF